VACQNTPAKTVKIPAAMRAKGYSDTDDIEAVDQALQRPSHAEIKRSDFCGSAWLLSLRL
jgi:hypothetical protein